jgi:hypothetical protein
MKYIKNKVAFIESDGCVKFVYLCKSSIKNNYLIKEKDYKTLKALKSNYIEKNLNLKFRKSFF